MSLLKRSFGAVPLTSKTQRRRLKPRPSPLAATMSAEKRFVFTVMKFEILSALIESMMSSTHAMLVKSAPLDERRAISAMASDASSPGRQLSTSFGAVFTFTRP